jgi:hypothetical protein
VATIRRLNAAIAGPRIGLRSSLAFDLINPDLLIILGILCSPMRMSIDGCCGRASLIGVRYWRWGKAGAKSYKIIVGIKQTVSGKDANIHHALEEIDRMHSRSARIVRATRGSRG